MLYPIGFHVCWPRSQGPPVEPMTRSGHGALVITARTARQVGVKGPGYAFVFAPGFRKAASPASDTSTHFGSGDAPAV